MCTIIRVRFIIAALGASASASLASRESSRDQTNQPTAAATSSLDCRLILFIALHCIFLQQLGGYKKAGRQAGRQEGLPWCVDIVIVMIMTR